MKKPGPKQEPKITAAGNKTKIKTSRVHSSKNFISLEKGTKEGDSLAWSVTCDESC